MLCDITKSYSTAPYLSMMYVTALLDMHAKMLLTAFFKSNVVKCSFLSSAKFLTYDAFVISIEHYFAFPRYRYPPGPREAIPPTGRRFCGLVAGIRTSFGSNQGSE